MRLNSFLPYFFYSRDFKRLTNCALLFVCLSFISELYAQVRSGGVTLTPQAMNDDQLIENYLQSKNYADAILLDSTNIKRFWIDKSVVGKDGSIIVSLSPNGKDLLKSRLLPIQLASVNESMDCTVTAIVQSPDVTFSIINKRQKEILDLSLKEDFISYHIYSSSFHLEDTPDFFFNFLCSSKTADTVAIKKIMLSFSKNKDSLYLASPGTLRIIPRNATIKNLVPESDGSMNITLSGTGSSIVSDNKILMADNALRASFKAKNTGSVPVRIRSGYGIYTKDNTRLDGKNYLPKEDAKIAKVISAEKGESSIFVDSELDSGKECYIALNAKADFSDIPNTNLLKISIEEVIKHSDSSYEIKLKAPLTKKIEKGTPIRLHIERGGQNLYVTNKVLQPGEEEVFTSTIQADDQLLQFAQQAFPKGTYYVKPLIYLGSEKRDESHVVEISDYTIVY